MKTRIPSVFLAVIVCGGAAKVHGTNPSGLTRTPKKVDVVATAASSAPQASTGRAISLTTTTAAGVSTDVVKLALGAVTCAMRSGAIAPPETLTVIDYSLPSVQPRLWVFDLAGGDLLFKELVAHGRNTGENLAKYFSNDPESRQSSLGLFVADEPYVGSNGYSLRLDGLEPGINDRARERAIVMHGAPYVDAAFVAAQGRIGRSWGCPALRPAIARQVIDRIRGGGAIFAYYPDPTWLRNSRFLTGCGGGSTLSTN